MKTTYSTKDAHKPARSPTNGQMAVDRSKVTERTNTKVPILSSRRCKRVAVIYDPKLTYAKCAARKSSRGK